jgi:hypothetical protein
LSVLLWCGFLYDSDHDYDYCAPCGSSQAFGENGCSGGKTMTLTQQVVTIAMHKWKRQMLISIAGGTACYMLLLHLL